MIRFPRLAAIGTLVICISAACSPQVSATPIVDSQATNIALGVLNAGSQTALAYSMLPTATETQTPAPSATVVSATQPPVVIHFAPCWFGPGPAYNLESNIKHGETVELLAVGTVPGWYIIRNPYFHQPCWIQAENLDLGPNFHAGEFPLMTPWPTRVVPTETPRRKHP